MYCTDFWTLWEKSRVGWSERIALKPVYYQVWNGSPVQVGCMRQVLRACARGWPRGMGWGGMWEGGSGWGTQVNPWLIHVNVWQKSLQYCKLISLQLIKIKGKKRKKKKMSFICSFSITYSPFHEFSMNIMKCQCLLNTSYPYALCYFIAFDNLLLSGEDSVLLKSGSYVCWYLILGKSLKLF